MKVTLKDVQKLREETGLGVMACRKALTEANGDAKKARTILAKKGEAVAAKKAERKTANGLVEGYVHGGKIGVLVELNCETDFVSKNPEFKEFAHDLAMQIASMDPKDTDELLTQEFIKDPSLTIKDLFHQKIQKIGENIKISKFVRYQLD